MKKLIFACSMMAIGCQRDIPNNQPPAPTIAIGNPCGTKIFEPFGDLAFRSSIVRSLPGFDPAKNDTLSVAYTPYGLKPPLWSTSIGVSDSTFSYVVNGSSVTLVNKLGGMMSYYVAALVHDCY